MEDTRPIVGVDLGGTKVLAGVVNGDGQVLSHSKHKTRALKGRPDALLDLIAEAVRGACAEASVDLGSVSAVGMGVPGTLTADRSGVMVAPNLGWSNVPVRDDLARRLDGARVGLENDVRSAALAEHVLGAGAGYSSMLAIFVGTGIGGGYIEHGKIVHGSRGGAAEFGQMVIQAGKGRCSCGNKGHLEALAARPALARYMARKVKRGAKSSLAGAHKGDLTLLTSGEIEGAIAAGDELAIRAAERSATYVGLALGSLVNAFDPDLVVLGGGVVAAIGQRYVDWAAVAARPHILNQDARSLPIVAAKLGDDAGLLGAALAARQE
jgi:glucokinase